jgi:hypothetical protein
MNNDIFNGRVNLYDNTQKKVININDITNEPPIYVKNQQNVYTLFFSQGNMDILQQGIRNSVYNQTGKIIGKQSEQELLIIMKSIYTEHSKNLPCNIPEQVKELNTFVLRWSVKEIISNMNAYNEYKKTVSTMPLPLEHSFLTSQRGTKILEIKSFI